MTMLFEILRDLLFGPHPLECRGFWRAPRSLPDVLFTTGGKTYLDPAMLKETIEWVPDVKESKVLNENLHTITSLRKV